MSVLLQCARLLRSSGRLLADRRPCVAAARPAQVQVRLAVHNRQHCRSLHSRVACFCAAQEEETNVIGSLGGRDIVKTGTVDANEFYVKTLTKDDVEANFSRSSGAGGQNVNKVSTKADIRFDVVNCRWMSRALKQAVMQREANRMNKNGELLISSQVTRSQADNLEDAVARLQGLLDDAAESIKPIESDPAKVKTLEKRKKKASAKRLDEKRKHKDKKASRKKVSKADY